MQEKPVATQEYVKLLEELLGGGLKVLSLDTTTGFIVTKATF